MRPDATIALAQRMTSMAEMLTAFGPHVVKTTRAAATSHGLKAGATSSEKVSGGGVSSTTETLALAPDDPTAKEYGRFVKAVADQYKAMDEIESILRAWQPARALMDNSPCPQVVVDDDGQVAECVGVLTETETSCTTCGMSRSTRTCRGCGKVMKPKQYRRRGCCQTCSRNFAEQVAAK